MAQTVNEIKNIPDQKYPWLDCPF